MDKFYGPRVKGASILGFWKYVKSQPRGEKLMEQVKEALPPDAAKVCSRKIIAVAEFPYPVFVEIIRAIDKVMGKGDLAACKKLGEYSAHRDLAALIQVSREKPKPEQFFSAMDLVWRNYHLDSGNMKIVEFNPERTVVRIENFPAMDPAHCRLMEGYLAQTLIEFGYAWAEPPRETQCMSRGGKYHEFTGKWR